jgi:hypothetical protein
MPRTDRPRLTVDQAVALAMYRCNEPLAQITQATSIGPAVLKRLAQAWDIVRHGTAEGIAQHHEREDDLCNRCSNHDASLRAQQLAQQRLNEGINGAIARYGRRAVIRRPTRARRRPAATA